MPSNKVKLNIQLDRVGKWILFICKINYLNKNRISQKLQYTYCFSHRQIAFFQNRYGLFGTVILYFFIYGFCRCKFCTIKCRSVKLRTRGVGFLIIRKWAQNNQYGKNLRSISFHKLTADEELLNTIIETV